jgi:hypothetical protein
MFIHTKVSLVLATLILTIAAAHTELRPPRPPKKT